MFWTLLVFGIVFALAIYFEVVPLNFRYVFLVLLTIGIAASITRYNLEYQYLGWQLPTIKSLFVYGVITLTAYAFLSKFNLVKSLSLEDTVANRWWNSSLFYFFISVPLQNILTRSFPLAIFHYFQWNFVLPYVLFSAVIFSFSHVFLKNVKITVYSFVMGLFWGLAFYYYPDFFLLCLSHFILGTTLIKHENLALKVTAT